MKILRIRINNLNSFKGKHELDLTKEPLASAGLFAITGSTGAGKSTLLDAITLALYGKVARYSNVSNPEHMMTRHCGECSAEVDFEVPGGVYTAVWQRHRAGKKSDGELQNARRRVYDETGREVAQKIREAEEKIVELLGLDYDRFLRSVLLAQGEFARFLRADSKQRSELLESLTGTRIYSKLGKRAHLEHKDRKDELRKRESDLERFPILENKIRKEYEEYIEQGDEERVKLIKEIEEGDEMLVKITNLEKWKVREKVALNNQKENKEHRKAAESDLKLLRWHELANPFADKLAQYDTVKYGLKSVTTKREEAEAAHASAKLKVVKENCLFRASINEELATCKNRLNEEVLNVANTTKEASEVRLWLDKHKHDKGLADQLPDLVELLTLFKSETNSLSDDWTTWRQSASDILPDNVEALPGNPENDSDLKGLLDEFIGKANSKEKELDDEKKKAKEQLKLRKDILDKTKLVQELEGRRNDLKSGDPCPLCGALEHPYAEGSEPSIEINKLQMKVDEAQEISEKASRGSEDFTSTLKALKDNRENLFDGVSKIASIRDQLNRKLQPFGVKSPIHVDIVEELKNELKNRNNAYSEKLKKEQEIKELKSNAERNVEQAKEQLETLSKKLSKLNPLPEGQSEQVAPDDIAPVNDAEKAYDHAVSEENTTKAQVNFNKSSEADERDKLSELQRNLENSLSATEFPTIDKLREARLEPAVAKKFEERDRKLKDEETEYKVLLNQASLEITKLVKEKVLEGEGAENFKNELDEKKRRKDDLLDGLATRRNLIKNDDENRERLMIKKNELEKFQKELNVWKRLADLIGSQDGSKFSRYAQSISLYILTRHANRHLAKFSDRYQICHDQEEELNLQVVDLYQAGTKRPMSSLSGGESFLTSLALALGLSDLAGRKVRIESLFIDEGFGNLDSETLESALSALECLRGDCKTVGIISHVELLKERISTQIVVEKKLGGESEFWIKPR